ncbi:hypothetical protein J6590_107451 [Homalodisca vitripennis]|nr:hypothetical protein J6590_107451 [Homalodisca vitripennis]
MEDRCYDLERTNRKLKEEVRDLHLQLQDIEQHSRSANIEIIGLPGTHGEDIIAYKRSLSPLMSHSREKTSLLPTGCACTLKGMYIRRQSRSSSLERLLQNLPLLTLSQPTFRSSSSPFMSRTLGTDHPPS